MKMLAAILSLSICLVSSGYSRAEAQNKTSEKTRILILTDIENEPDDAQSLVRFLLYSNQFDVEGIVATTSCWQRDKIADWRIHEIVDAYGEVRDNLEKHESGYPTLSKLKGVIKKAYPDYGMSAVGEGKDSEGSDWIIQTVDQDDPRPVWIPVWGGANCLAQALWKVSQTRSEQEVEKFVSKIRVYTISDQDNAGPWIRNTYPKLFYIVSPGYHEKGGNAYYYATWTGISGEKHYSFSSLADTSLVNNHWVDENIQIAHGPLGEQYPDIAYIMEGDSPSFLYLINNGMNSPEHPNWGSWGGRYELYKPYTRPYYHEAEQREIWTDAEDWIFDGTTLYISRQATIWRWREHFQNDFAARMDWCVSSYKNANHPPEVNLNHDSEMLVESGDSIILDASNSLDPDGDSLSIHWMYYPEAGTHPPGINFKPCGFGLSEFFAPEVNNPVSLHFIAVVSDKGDPALTRYQRVIIRVKPIL